MDTLSTHDDSLENRVDNLLKLEVLEAFDRTAFERVYEILTFMAGFRV